MSFLWYRELARSWKQYYCLHVGLILTLLFIARVATIMPKSTVTTYGLIVGLDIIRWDWLGVSLRAKTKYLANEAGIAVRVHGACCDARLDTARSARAAYCAAYWATAKSHSKNLRLRRLLHTTSAPRTSMTVPERVSSRRPTTWQTVGLLRSIPQKFSQNPLLSAN